MLSGLAPKLQEEPARKPVDQQACHKLKGTMRKAGVTLLNHRHSWVPPTNDETATGEASANSWVATHSG